METIGQDITPY